MIGQLFKFALKHPIMTTAGVGTAAHFATGGQSTEAGKNLVSGGLSAISDNAFGNIGDFLSNNALTVGAGALGALVGGLKGGWISSIICGVAAAGLAFLAQKHLFKNSFNTAAQGPGQTMQLTADQQATNKRTFDTANANQTLHNNDGENVLTLSDPRNTLPEPGTQQNYFGPEPQPE